MTKIIFCLPGNSFTSNFIRSWTAILSALPANGIHPIISLATDPVIYFVRNKCLGGDVLRGHRQHPFDGKVDYDYIMWIDSDMVFNADAMLILLDHKLDICSATYAMRGGQSLVAVKDWDAEYFSKNGNFEFIRPDQYQGLIECVYTGFGFMLIKHGVFEALEYPWFRPEYNNFNGFYDFCSEDVSFCLAAAKAGFKIWLDTNVRVGHEKAVIF